MRSFLIEYQDGDETKGEVIKARSSMLAIKALCDKLRRRGNPVELKLVKVTTVTV